MSQAPTMKERNTTGKEQPRQRAHPTKKPEASLPWRSLEQQVVRMQKQITQAAQRGDMAVVHDLQQRLMESEPARLLAVRRVAQENQGKDTAGVDGVKSLGKDERLAMAEAIHPQNWSAQPVLPMRRVWVPKPGTTERRPLSILPMIDRCKQALVKLALEPEWEARFEAHSYGFRPGRSAYDAIAAIVVAIERNPLFVFNTDIADAFNHVDQAVVLSKLRASPMLRQVIHAWLVAGVVDGKTSSKSARGIAQGGVLSPLFMNVTLHGLEAVATSDEGIGHSREQPLLVRYADNFIILHPDLDVLHQAIRRVRHWLATMGLHLGADKTSIAHTLIPTGGQVGFDFLGFHIRQQEDAVPSRGSEEMEPLWTRRPGRLPEQGRQLSVRTIITPSREAITRHLAAIDQRLQQAQSAPQALLIKALNPLIVGWVAYYNGVVEARVMGRFDSMLEQRLIKWALLRHPGEPRDRLLARYWQRVGNQKVFATQDGIQLRRYQQMSILGN